MVTLNMRHEVLSMIVMNRKQVTDRGNDYADMNNDDDDANDEAVGDNDNDGDKGGGDEYEYGEILKRASCPPGCRHLQSE